MMNPLDRIHVVLVRPMYPRNIGMCARSMANMGVSHLVLVAPQCELDYEAKQGATHAQEILQKSKTYVSLADFYKAEGEGVRVALSARAGGLRQPTLLSKQLEEMGESSRLRASNDPIYLLFGPEDDGLSDDEIKDAHHVCSLPTYGYFYSMNISHAVMLSLYLVAQSLDARPKLAAAGTLKEQQFPKREPKFFPEETIKTWLTTLGMDVESHRVNAARTLTRILLENEPTQDELRVLEAIIQQTVRKLKND